MQKSAIGMFAVHGDIRPETFRSVVVFLLLYIFGERSVLHAYDAINVAGVAKQYRFRGDLRNARLFIHSGELEFSPYRSRDCCTREHR